MGVEKAVSWVQQSKRRTSVLLALKQPLTVLQLADHASLTRSQCSRVLWELCLQDLVICLNSFASKCRVYWLTEKGRCFQRILREKLGLPEPSSDFPHVDWTLYGYVSNRHRSAVIKAMEGALQPAKIKRKARFENPRLRMSANNCRDIVKLFAKKEIVKEVDIRGRSHKRFELTELGKKLQELLRRAETKT